MTQVCRGGMDHALTTYKSLLHLKEDDSQATIVCIPGPYSLCTYRQAIRQWSIAQSRTSRSIACKRGPSLCESTITVQEQPKRERPSRSITFSRFRSDPFSQATVQRRFATCSSLFQSGYSSRTGAVDHCTTHFVVPGFTPYVQIFEILPLHEIDKFLLFADPSTPLSIIQGKRCCDQCTLHLKITEAVITSI